MHRSTKIIALSLMLFLLALPATAWSLPLANTSLRSVQDIKDKWVIYKPTSASATYLVTPSWTFPYNAGVLQPSYVGDALNQVNFARWLVGLPDDVALDADYNNQAQHASLLLAALGRGLDHNPSKPVDMDQSFYDIALAGASSSNLAAGPGLPTTIKLYLQDSDNYNIFDVGHRRWVLNPPMTHTGFGWVFRSDSLYLNYSAMHVFQEKESDARRDPIEYSSFGWPSAGMFPLEYFEDNTAWSIQLNDNVYDYDWTGLKVTLTRVKDGHRWTFDHNDISGGTNLNGEFFYMDSPGYGEAASIIFRPEIGTHYKEGDVFQVHVDGALFAQGTKTPRQIDYEVSFFQLIPTNYAPVSHNDNAAVLQDTLLTVPAPGVLANDTDANGDILTAQLAADALHGHVELNEDGSYTYQPNPGYVGTDYFKYYTYDGQEFAINVAHVNITVREANIAPVGTDDFYHVYPDTTLTVNPRGVLQNDFDRNGDAMTACLVSNPEHGTVTLQEDGSFVYVPETGYTGSDSFRYQVWDGMNVSEDTTVNLEINIIDTIAPTTTANHVAYYADYAAFDFVAVDDNGGSGVAHTYYSLDGYDAVEATSIVVTGTGSHTLTYWSVDSAGNTEAENTVSFTILSTPGNRPTTPKISSTRVIHRHSYTYSGYVARHTAGTYPVTIRFYRYRYGKYRYYKSVSAKAYNMLSFTKYSRSISVPYTGKWRVRAVHRVGGRNIYSSYRYFRVY